MAKDSRLEQLKVTKEQFFIERRDAYHQQKNSSICLSNARDKMDKAFEVKQAAFKDQGLAWQEYQLVSDRNSPRIERLDHEEDKAHQKMTKAFRRASYNSKRHDKASIQNRAKDGLRYKSEAQGYTKKQNRLIDECRNSKALVNFYSNIFNNAKIDFNNAKVEFEQAKVDHKVNKEAFMVAKVNFDKATEAFSIRQNELNIEIKS